MIEVIEFIAVAPLAGMLAGLVMQMMCFPLHRYEWADKMMTCGLAVVFGSACTHLLLVLVAALAGLVTK